MMCNGATHALCMRLRSMGQAIIFTGEAVAIVLGGNLAYAFQQAGISWRAAPLGLAVAAGVLCIVIAATIKEPPKGRFIVRAVRARCINGSCCSTQAAPKHSRQRPLMAAQGARAAAWTQRGACWERGRKG